MTVDKSGTRTVRAIEDSFPIVEINRLAVPERNGFKPIYQMHKWFARRASCVFRAILLGCLKPLPVGDDGRPTKTGAEVIMGEFYRDHTNDPDTNGRVILDPFMGGGTTVVEGLRLGCRVIGIDLNPVAWFIVKTEVEPVNPAALEDALERLARRTVPWSKKPLREALLDQYRTQCPCCGAVDADVMCTLWVKSAICTACNKQVHLFKDYVVAQKSPSIRYFRDVSCPRCLKTFDWELEPAALVAEAALQVNSPAYSAGVGRSTVRWAYSPSKTVTCPWCSEEATALPSKAKRERKKIPLAVLLCPFCQTVWQWRGELPERVNCPVCRKEYNPLVANIPDKGEFQCSCGHRDDIIRSIRQLPEGRLLPIHPYAIEGYCASCAGDDVDAEGSEDERNGHLFAAKSSPAVDAEARKHDCRTFKNGGRFFKRVTPVDLCRIDDAVAAWEREKGSLPYPKQAIPNGQETHRLLEHRYQYWHQMFHSRQLLCLATVLGGIQQESNTVLQDMLLSTFQALLERNNLFCRYFDDRDTVQGCFARHDYQPKLTTAEANVWGRKAWRGTVPNMHARTVDAKRYCLEPYDLTACDGKSEHVRSTETTYAGSADLLCMDAREIRGGPTCEFLVTDPPYVGNVNYAELAEFFYVWLRLVLSHRYPEFAPDQTPWVSEIVENPTRNLSRQDFTDGLTAAFTKAAARLQPEGLLAFTFHHAENTAWEAVLRAVCDAGFEIVAAYPVHGEKESSSQLMATEGISYDLIHLCRKRSADASHAPRSWAGIRQEIRRRARAEIAAIEAGRYGNNPLPLNDLNIVLIGKCLELYSRHYGAVVHEGKSVPLHEALKQIRDIADQMVEREHPLPSELDDIDPESRIYLRALCRVKEVKSDEVHKATRGVLEPADLIEAGLITKMRASRGRSYEVKQPGERVTKLLERFGSMAPSTQASLFSDSLPSSYVGTLFVDRVHLLLGLVEAGENLLPWLEGFRAETPQIRAAMEYIEGHSKHLAAGCRRVLNLLEVGPLLKGTT